MDNDVVLKKLRFSHGISCLVVNAPGEYPEILKMMKADTKMEPSGDKKDDFIRVFATTNEEPNDLTVKIISKGKYDCLFWACYPN